MSCTVLCASAQFARRSSGRRAAFSSWHPARQRAIRLRIHGERRKARCFRDAAGSLLKQTLAATPETLAPSAASGGAANCLLHCGTRVPRACGAEPSTVRRHRERPAQTRPPSLATLQAFTSPASRHSFNPASPRRIVGFIVPRGTANALGKLGMRQAKVESHQDRLGLRRFKQLQAAVDIDDVKSSGGTASSMVSRSGPDIGWLALRRSMSIQTCRTIAAIQWIGCPFSTSYRAD